MTRGGRSSCPFARGALQLIRRLLQRQQFRPKEYLDRTVPPFAVSLLLQHRSESTVTEDLRHIRGEIDMGLIIEALDARAALKGATHAVDIPADKICTVLHAAFYRVCSPSAVILGFLWTSGFRCQDLSQIRRMDGRLSTSRSIPRRTSMPAGAVGATSAMWLTTRHGQDFRRSALTEHGRNAVSRRWLVPTRIRPHIRSDALSSRAAPTPQE